MISTAGRYRNQPRRLDRRLLAPWGANHNEARSGRPKWHSGQQLNRRGRRHQRHYCGSGFLCRLLSALELLRQTNCRALDRRPDFTLNSSRSQINNCGGASTGIAVYRVNL
jgi:hypothetical protein